jgi:hypothetical protein
MHATKQPMSPLTALFLGTTAIIVATITSASVIVIYGINVGDRWGKALILLAGETVEDLPEFLESMPPGVGDYLNDEREPGYAEQLEVRVSAPGTGPRGKTEMAVTVTNNGKHTVTLLPIRFVAMDSRGTPYAEWSEYAATPITVEHDLRGPLLPGSTRIFSTGYWCESAKDPQLEWEITDVRIWSRSGAVDNEA